MNPRIRLALMAAVALTSIALAVAVLLGNAGPANVASASGFDGGQINVRAADFQLVDQDGRRVSLSSYRGQVVIVTFMYSTCQNTCPVEADQIRGALDDLGRSVPALAVSVDPTQDTPLNAKRFLAHQSLVGRMRFLLGPRAALSPIWHAYGIAPETGSVVKVSNHSAYVMLIDRRQHLRVGFPDSQLTPESLAHDIRLLEAEPR